MLEQTVGVRGSDDPVLAVILVLLIACANVANLLLARAAAVALKTPLGWYWLMTASSSEICCSQPGRGIGVLLAWWGVAYWSISARPTFRDLKTFVSMGVCYGFTLGLSLLTGLIFGLAPALQTTLKLSETLNGGALGGGGQARACPGSSSSSRWR